MDIGIQIVTDRRVSLKFDIFPAQAHQNLLAAITSSTERLRDLVEGAVPKKTGELASMIFSQVQDYPNRITGLVGVRGADRNELAKAAAEEYGAHGTAHVRAHKAKLGHLFAKAIEPIEVLVSAHDRHVNILQREFLRGPLRQIEAQALEAMQQAVEEAISA